MSLTDGRIDGLKMPARWPEIGIFLLQAFAVAYFGGQLSQAIENNSDNIEKAFVQMAERDQRMEERIAELEARREKVVDRLARIEVKLDLAISKNNDSGSSSSGHPK